MGRRTPAVTAALVLCTATSGAAQSVNMGETFHRLEAHARRVTLTFPDASIDVRRTEGGGLEGQLRQRTGAPGGRLLVLPGERRVQWTAEPAGVPQEFTLPEQARVSLDWAGHQLYALHADTGADEGRAPDLTGDAGTWDGHVRRNRSSVARGVSAGALAARLERVETVFDDLVVRAAIDIHERRPGRAGRVDYSRFTATIHDARTGARRGFVRWFDTAQVLTWKIDGGSEGVVLPERMRGGWTFTPTMAWANVQAYQFATQATRRLREDTPFASVLGHLIGGPQRAEPLARVARALAPVPATAWDSLTAMIAPGATPDMPTLPARWSAPWAFGGARAANDPGCDRLHWLDGSIFRACCDEHDRCYEKNGCSESSWFWPFSGSWSCQRCNAQAVYCFCTMSNPAYCGGGGTGSNGGPQGGGCTSVAGGFCPVECQSCQSH